MLSYSIRLHCQFIGYMCLILRLSHWVGLLFCVFDISYVIKYLWTIHNTCLVKNIKLCQELLKLKTVIWHFLSTRISISHRDLPNIIADTHLSPPSQDSAQLFGYFEPPLLLLHSAVCSLRTPVLGYLCIFHICKYVADRDAGTKE